MSVLMGAPTVKVAIVAVAQRLARDAARRDVNAL